MIIAGVDEAGRGPLYGEVVAAAVILPKEHKITGINDSKKLSPKAREKLFDEICATALCWHIASASAKEIDEINILQATMLAMQRAVMGLKTEPTKVLIDGNRAPKLVYPVDTIIKGDAKFEVIAAASILAKVYRDRKMHEVDKLYPEYGFAKHKGYGTKQHIEAIQKYGQLPEHRKSFSVAGVNC